MTTEGVILKCQSANNKIIDMKNDEYILFKRKYFLLMKMT